MFKHTADVVEDYICYFLTAIGAIALSVRFLSSLGTGDLSCIIAGEIGNKYNVVRVLFFLLL